MIFIQGVYLRFQYKYYGVVIGSVFGRVRSQPVLLEKGSWTQFNYANKLCLCGALDWLQDMQLCFVLIV